MGVHVRGTKVDRQRQDRSGCGEECGLQWNSPRTRDFLLKALEDFNSENREEKEMMSMGELSDSGWFSDDSGGSGSLNFMEDIEDDLGYEDLGEFENED